MPMNAQSCKTTMKVKATFLMEYHLFRAIVVSIKIKNQWNKIYTMMPMNVQNCRTTTKVKVTVLIMYHLFRVIVVSNKNKIKNQWNQIYKMQLMPYPVIKPNNSQLCWITTKDQASVLMEYHLFLAIVVPNKIKIKDQNKCKITGSDYQNYFLRKYNLQ